MQAFQPLSPVYTFTANSSAPSSVQPVSAGTVRATQVMITNVSATVTVVVGWGSSDAIAKANAVINSSSQQFAIAPLTQIPISVAETTYFTGIGASSAVVYVQAGLTE